jgi:hypothetical protein
MLHVPNFGAWELCYPGNYGVFADSTDNSPYPNTLLPQLLEQINVLVWHGLEDFLLLSDGDRFMIQNVAL